MAQTVWMQQMMNCLVGRRPVFACGGTVEVSRPITIAFTGTGDQSNFQALELKENVNLDGLLAAMEAASFGRGSELVLDPSYRQALKLDSTRFLTNFQPSEYHILEVVKDMLVPRTCYRDTKIRMELYNLNAYKVGGFFKPHVDTPSTGLLGTLVVALPYGFTGGELEVSDDDRSYSFCSFKSNSTISWAAFYSDCVHEVKEVTSGVRLTLTYNLFYDLEESDGEDQSASDSPLSLPQMRIDPSSSAISELFVKAKPFFQGTILGFACRHFYPFPLKGEQDLTCNQMARLLKGVDAELFASALAAGLPTVVRPIWKTSAGKYKVGQNFRPPKAYNYGVYEDDHDAAEHKDVPGITRNITWCNDNLRWAHGTTIAYYGNDVSALTSYCAVAILVKVPGEEATDTDDDDEPFDPENHDYASFTDKFFE